MVVESKPSVADAPPPKQMTEEEKAEALRKFVPLPVLGDRVRLALMSLPGFKSESKKEKKPQRRLRR